MSYGNYTKYKIKMCLCFRFRFFERSKNRVSFGIVGVFCIIDRYFEYRIRILCIFLYMGTYFKCIFEHCSTQQIEPFRPPQSTIFPEVWTIFVSRICGDFFGFVVPTDPLTSPLPPAPSVIDRPNDAGTASPTRRTT